MSMGTVQHRVGAQEPHDQMQDPNVSVLPQRRGRRHDNKLNRLDIATRSRNGRIVQDSVHDGTR
jgi:hypothetical protein